MPNPRARKLRELPGTNGRRNRYGKGPYVPGDCHQSPAVPKSRVQEATRPSLEAVSGSPLRASSGSEGTGRPWPVRGPEGPAEDRKGPPGTGGKRKRPETRAGRSGPQAPRRRALTHLRRIRHRSWLLSGGDWPKTTGGMIAAAATPLPANAGPASLQLPTPPPSGNKAAAARPLHSHSCWFLVSANDKGPGLASSQSECGSAASSRGFAFLANERQLWGRGEVEATEEGKERGCRQEGAELCGRVKWAEPRGAGGRMGGASTSEWKSEWGSFSGGFPARGVSGRAMGGASWGSGRGFEGALTRYGSYSQVGPATALVLESGWPGSQWELRRRKAGVWTRVRVTSS